MSGRPLRAACQAIQDPSATIPIEIRIGVVSGPMRNTSGSGSRNDSLTLRSTP
jgi:class 3 adenylate cyclase